MIDKSPLSIACDKGHRDAVELLLMNKADPNVKTYIERHTSHGPIPWSVSLLTVPYRDRNIDIMKLLLDYGVSPGSRVHDSNGCFSSLLTASMDEGFIDGIKLALACGATCSSYQTMLLYSNHNKDTFNYAETVNAMLPYLSDTILYQCVCFSVENNKPDMLDYILASGRIDPNLKIGSIDAITIAINNNYTDVVDVLNKHVSYSTSLPSTDIEQC